MPERCNQYASRIGEPTDWSTAAAQSGFDSLSAGIRHPPRLCPPPPKEFIVIDDGDDGSLVPNDQQLNKVASVPKLQGQGHGSFFAPISGTQPSPWQMERDCILSNDLVRSEKADIPLFKHVGNGGLGSHDDKGGKWQQRASVLQNVRQNNVEIPGPSGGRKSGSSSTAAPKRGSGGGRGSGGSTSSDSKRPKVSASSGASPLCSPSCSERLVFETSQVDVHSQRFCYAISEQLSATWSLTYTYVHV